MARNPAQPAPGVRLCGVAEISDPGAKGFLFREADMLFLGFIVRRNGRVTGYIDRCPHTGLPLAPFPDRYFTREGDLLICGSHGALFRPDDGFCVAGPCAGRSLWPWPVRLEGDGVFTA